MNNNFKKNITKHITELYVESLKSEEAQRVIYYYNTRNQHAKKMFYVSVAKRSVFEDLLAQIANDNFDAPTQEFPIGFNSKIKSPNFSK